MKTEPQHATTRHRVSGPTALTAPLADPTDDGVKSEEMLRVLQRAARDYEFIAEIAERGSTALRDYRLTLEDKAALVCGDIRWTETRVGPLSDRQCTLLNCMLEREAW